MNISDFEQYEGYWEIIDDNLFDEIFILIVLKNWSQLKRSWRPLSC